MSDSDDRERLEVAVTISPLGEDEEGLRERQLAAILRLLQRAAETRTTGDRRERR
jgi:hypothetical protein